MIYGVDTQRAFIGRCVSLRTALDSVIEKEYGSDPPVSLAHLFQLKLLRDLIGANLRGDHSEYVVTLYASVDDPILKYAIDEDHLWYLTVNASGYYLANSLPKGY